MKPTYRGQDHFFFHWILMRWAAMLNRISTYYRYTQIASLLRQFLFSAHVMVVLSFGKAPCITVKLTGKRERLHRVVLEQYRSVTCLDMIYSNHKGEKIIPRSIIMHVQLPRLKISSSAQCWSETERLFYVYVIVIHTFMLIWNYDLNSWQRWLPQASSSALKWHVKQPV